MMRVDMQVHEEYKDGRVKNYTDSVFFHELKVLTEAQRIEFKYRRNEN